MSAPTGMARVWGDRTATHRHLAFLLLWASRLAGVAFLVDMLDRSLRVVGMSGAALLLAAPLVAMLVAAIQYIRERDWKEAGLALLLMVMLLAGAWLGGA
jgi:phage tail sheath protein FI